MYYQYLTFDTPFCGAAHIEIFRTPREFLLVGFLDGLDLCFLLLVDYKISLH